MSSFNLRTPEYCFGEAEFLQDSFRIGMIAAIATTNKRRNIIEINAQCKILQLFREGEFSFSTRINIAGIGGASDWSLVRG